MNVVAGAEDERSHLGVPAVALVAEVNASFQKLTHIERRKRHRVVLIFRLSLRGSEEDRFLEQRKLQARQPTGATGQGFYLAAADPHVWGEVRCL